MRAILLATALATPLALPAVAQDATGVAPVYGQILAYPMPQGFMPAFENEQNGDYILELVPEGQSLDEWEEMITITGAQGLAEQASAYHYGKSIGLDLEENCLGSFEVWDENPQEIAGALDAHLFVFACGDAGGRAETTAILVVEGVEDLYTFQWANRTAPFDGQPEMDTDFWKPRAEMLISLQLCDIIEGEEPPYPSCTG